jgi:hypothetical protein
VVSVPADVCHHILPGLEGVRARDLAELHLRVQNSIIQHMP